MDDDDKLTDTIVSYVKIYFAFRFLMASIAMLIGMIAGVCFVCYWVYQEVSLELSYQRKYGVDWKTEFERYHGSLSHAHTQIAVCVSCMIALALVLGWFCHKTFHLHLHHRRHDHVA
jgi:putative Mn2+ efflux pump MntP